MINKKDRTAEQLAQAAGVAAMSSAATQRVDVERFFFDFFAGCFSAGPGGEWVRYSDYSALLQQLAEAEHDRDMCNAEAIAADRRLTHAESKLAERDAEIARLGEELDVANTALGQATTDCVEASFRAEAAERAREVAVRAVNWYADNQSMVTECNGKWFAVVGNRDEVVQCDNGLDAIVAAFLAANGGGQE